MVMTTNMIMILKVLIILIIRNGVPLMRICTLCGSKITRLPASHQQQRFVQIIDFQDILL